MAYIHNYYHRNTCLRQNINNEYNNLYRFTLYSEVIFHGEIHAWRLTSMGCCAYGNTVTVTIQHKHTFL